MVGEARLPNNAYYPRTHDYTLDSGISWFWRKRFLSVFIIYGHGILFGGAEPFEQIDNTPSIEGLMWNLVKIGQDVSEKKTFKDYKILFMYIAQGQRQITPWTNF